jgi:hypothetical protein
MTESMDLLLLRSRKEPQPGNIELIVAYPVEHGTLASVALTLEGTGLFLAGHALFEWAAFGTLPRSRGG